MKQIGKIVFPWMLYVGDLMVFLKRIWHKVNPSLLSFRNLSGFARRQIHDFHLFQMRITE